MPLLRHGVKDGLIQARDSENVCICSPDPQRGTEFREKFEQEI